MAAVSGALALPLTAQAVDFAVSGHVNRAIYTVNGDGNDSDLQHRDANVSQSRFRIRGSGELDNGLTAGVYMEYGASGGDLSPFFRRHSNIYLSGDGGTLTIGHGSTATDGMVFARLGGPSWLGGVTNGCPYFNGAASTRLRSPACESNNGTRTDVLRYDTPALGPVSISTSIGNNEYWDGMIKIAGSVGESGYDLRLGYITEFDAVTPDPHPVTIPPTPQIPLTPSALDPGETLGASAAFKFGQGTSIAFSWTDDDNDTGDDESYHAEIDHSYGDGSVGVYFRNGEVGNNDASVWGVGFGHDLGAGTQVYAGYRHLDDFTDHVGTAHAETDLFLVGMRVTFN